MPHRLIHMSEFMTGIFLAVNAGATYLLMAATSQTQEEALRWSLLPLMGALIAAAVCYLFNKDREAARIVVGRTTFALVGGVLLPRLASFSSYFSEIVTDPIIVIALGFMASGACYFVSKPAVDRWSKRSQSIADDIIDGAMDAAKNKLKSMGLTTPQSILDRWPVPPLPGSPDHELYQSSLAAEIARMQELAKLSQSNLP